MRDTEAAAAFPESILCKRVNSDQQSTHLLGISQLCFETSNYFWPFSLDVDVFQFVCKYHC